MTDYEYVTKKVQRGRAGDREINKLAGEGWEIVSRSQQLNAFDRITFKRDRVAAEARASEKAREVRLARDEEVRRREELGPEGRRKENLTAIIGIAVIVAVIALLVWLGS